MPKTTQTNNNKPIIGIDLGTTNSAIGCWQEGRVVLIPNALGSKLTPSVVSIDEDQRVLVGMSARERQVTHPLDTASAFKRSIGSPQTYTLRGRTYNAEDLSALVLRQLKADAEAYLQQPVTDAVIAVPAYFNDRQRHATRRAAQLAGLEVERLINEPTAAALAYGIDKLQQETKFLVLDLGGGTFDVTVLEIFEGVIEVRASTGDNWLGGEDFNEVLIEHFFKIHRDALREDSKRSNETLYQAMRDQAERARRALSSAESATMSVVWHKKSFECDITEPQWQALATPVIARVREPLQRALRDSGLAPSDLTEIVLVGGATRMPILRRTVAQLFGRFPAGGPNPDETIAVGATVQAALKARDSALQEVILTDVCPYSLGVDIAEQVSPNDLRDGVFSPIIERNTVLPVSRVQTYCTLRNGQPLVKFTIYQGESRMVANNFKIGEIEIPVPPRPAGQVTVDVRFTYDVNGLLEVDVSVPANGTQRQLVIADEASRMDAASFDKRRAALAKLKFHPRDTESNRAALARAARCYEQSLGERREAVGSLIAAFETVLARQHERDIDQARAHLHQQLDQLEGPRLL